MFRGKGVKKNQYIGELTKRGALGQFANLREWLGKKEMVVLFWGGYPNAHYNFLMQHY